MQHFPGKIPGIWTPEREKKIVPDFFHSSYENSKTD